MQFRAVIRYPLTVSSKKFKFENGYLLTDSVTTMSSHHFVKEGQEPALFILEAFSFDLVAPLLEWAPLVMVSDSAIEKVLLWGIKIDVVLQDSYSMEALEKILASQHPVQIHASDSGNSVLRGLQFLIQRKIKAVNLINTPTKIFFKEIDNFSQQLQIGVFCEHQKWSAIVSGKFEKWMKIGSTLIIWHDSTSSLHLHGLKEKDAAWETTASGMVTVESKSPFWIGEYI